MTDRIHRFDALDNFQRLRRLRRRRRTADRPGAAVPVGAPGPGHGRATWSGWAGWASAPSSTCAGPASAATSRRAGPPAGPGRSSRVAHDDGGEAPHITFLKTADLTVDAGRRFMTDTYRRLPFETGHLDLFARYFRALGDGEGAVLIHCAAGKDRTGAAGRADPSSVLGVHRDDMVADYLLTNTAVDLEGPGPRHRASASRR